MTPINAPTLDQVLTLAQRLTARDKLLLIARLAPQVSAVLPVTMDEADDQLAELDALIAESAAIGPAERESADVISEMRR